MDQPLRTAQVDLCSEATGTSPAVVIDYDPRWPEDFDLLRSHLQPVVAGVALSVEHVGSTAVAGLAAKPIIDVDVVVADEPASRAAVRALAEAGWAPEGDLGIAGRQAFQARPGLPHHHLYVVIAGSQPHLDHVLQRDHLRRNPTAVTEYAALKKELTPLLRQDRQAYLDAKSALVQRLLPPNGHVSRYITRDMNSRRSDGAISASNDSRPPEAPGVVGATHPRS